MSKRELQHAQQRNAQLQVWANYIDSQSFFWMCLCQFPIFLEIHQVAIYSDEVADNMNAIEITGADSAKNYIPIKREGSEPS